MADREFFQGAQLGVLQKQQLGVVCRRGLQLHCTRSRAIFRQCELCKRSIAIKPRVAIVKKRRALQASADRLIDASVAPVIIGMLHVSMAKTSGEEAQS